MHYLIIDLEATCWESGGHSERMEIIEIGAVMLEAANGPIMREYDAFVRPVLEPRLSAFCTELTTIRQQDVDAADDFPTVFQHFLKWIGPDPFVFCSWGRYDLNQLRADCARYRRAVPPYFEWHVDLKQSFAAIYDYKPCGMPYALQLLNLPLEGTHHRGIDDVRNIAKIATRILPIIEKHAG